MITGSIAWVLFWRSVDVNCAKEPRIVRASHALRARNFFKKMLLDKTNIYPTEVLFIFILQTNSHGSAGANYGARWCPKH